jgi:hypothetical protein
VAGESSIDLDNGAVQTLSRLADHLATSLADPAD